MSTPRHKQMLRNLRQLRKEFLPRNFDPTGTYKDSKRARAAAYRVMAHAEIESFIEERVRTIATSAVATWKVDGITCRALLGLLAFNARSVEDVPDSLQPPQSGQAAAWSKKVELAKRLDGAVTIFNSTISKNHGIKEENLLRLLLPIGLETSKLDPTWLADMNSFGSVRGALAHAPMVRTAVNPKDEFNAVRNLLPSLAQLDKDLEELL